jgi:hypothetical protein
MVALSPALVASITALGTKQYAPVDAVLALSHYLPRSVTNGSNGDAEDVEDESSEDALCSLWLGAVVHGTAAAFLASILRISHLSESGAHQLATDIGILPCALVSIAT